MRFIPVVCLSLLSAASASGQVLFRGDLSGGQEVPPNASAAGGWASVVLNTTTMMVDYDVRTWGLVATAAHIHVGTAGTNGGILVPLAGGPTAWTGTSTTVFTPTQVTTLQTDGMYVNVHTTAFPGGEIRAQLDARPLLFSAVLEGSQEVPPNASAATGTSTVTANADNTLTYTANVAGMTPTAAHIHDAPFGTAGGIVFGFTATGPTTYSGTTPVMSADTFNKLQTKGLYVNVHSTAFPGGEVRGQLVATSVPYGFGCPGATMKNATLGSTGAPMTGKTITLTVTGGQPSAGGVLVVSLTGPEAALFSGCQLLVKTPEFARFPVGLNAAGSGSLNQTLPPTLASDLNAYVQFWGMDNTGALYNSNGLLVTVETKPL